MKEPVDITLKLDFAIAVHTCDMTTVRDVLAAYPDALKWKDVEGGTALRKAVAHGSPKIDVVKYLIDGGSDINAVDHEGFSVLHLAALHAEIEVVRLLLEKGVKTDVIDKKDRTAADLANEYDHHETADMIAAHEQRLRAAEELRRQAAERAAIDADADQAHRGLGRSMRVSKPLVMKR